MSKVQIRFQELLEGVRIDWVGEEVPERIQVHARDEVKMLSDACRKMRAMTIECRPEDCRVGCNCIKPNQGIRATRPTLLDALWAFDQTLRKRCLG